MHLESRARLRLEAATDWLPRWLAVVFPFSIAGSVLGQGYLVPPPGFQGAPTVPQMGVPSGSTSQAGGPANGQINLQPNAEANNGQGNGQPEGQPEGQQGQTTAAPAAPVQSLMQWGALHLHARASYQFLYATGVHSGPGQSADTYSQTFSPGVTISLGPHVSLDYSPSFRFFSQRDFHNTIDHSVSLSAGAGYGDWSFGLSQSYSRLNEPVVETSSQTDEETYATSLSASYRFNDKISFDTSGSVGLTVINGNSSSTIRTNTGPGGPITGQTGPPLADSQSYSGAESMNYQFDDKLTGGLSVTVGYSEQNGGFRALNEQYQGHVTWKPGSKLTAFVSGGIEDEQFLNTHAPDIVTPILSASIGYHLFEQTTLSLLASRGVNASLFQSEVTETTQLGIGLQQRLLGELQLSLGFGYGTSDYKSTTTQLSTTRSDESTSYTVGLSLPFLKHGSFGAFYDYTRNSSSDSGFSISSSQVGATLNWAY